MAKGSHATWSPGDSRTCIICGKKIALVHGAHIHYDNVTGNHTSTHLTCERSTMTEVDETSPSETQPEPEPYPPNPEPEPEPEPPDTEDEPDEEEDVA